jgi:SAM-dependent methyltransferase
MTDDLDDISRRTLAHYERNAQGFFAGTVDHDVSQNVTALLDAIEAPAPFTLLDLGCGPGRDLKTFTGLGHRAIGLDGAAEFAAMARAYSGCEVWHQDFLHLDLPPEVFDGVFANASLFHVPSAALPGVLAALYGTLKPGGVLFSSNPRGHNEEGWNGARYGSYHDYPTWERYLVTAGFVPLHHYYRPPGVPREQQPWLASLWRKPANVIQRTESEGDPVQDRASIPTEEDSS